MNAPCHITCGTRRPVGQTYKNMQKYTPPPHDIHAETQAGPRRRSPSGDTLVEVAQCLLAVEKSALRSQQRTHRLTLRTRHGGKRPFQNIPRAADCYYRIYRVLGAVHELCALCGVVAAWLALVHPGLRRQVDHLWSRPHG